jgi:hypothetical protein
MTWVSLAALPLLLLMRRPAPVVHAAARPTTPD